MRKQLKLAGKRFCWQTKKRIDLLFHTTVRDDVDKCYNNRNRMSENGEKGGKGGNDNVIRGLFRGNKPRSIQKTSDMAQGKVTGDISQISLSEDSERLLAKRNAYQILQEFRGFGMTVADIYPELKDDAMKMRGRVLRTHLANHRGPVVRTDIFLLTIAQEYTDRIATGGEI